MKQQKEIKYDLVYNRMGVPHLPSSAFTSMMRMYPNAYYMSEIPVLMNANAWRPEHVRVPFYREDLCVAVLWALNLREHLQEHINGRIMLMPVIMTCVSVWMRQGLLTGSIIIPAELTKYVSFSLFPEDFVGVFPTSSRDFNIKAAYARLFDA